MPLIVPVEMDKNSMLQRMDHFLLPTSKAYLTIAILTIQVLLLYVDYVTGPWVPFGVFYLLSIYFAIKYLGSRAAYVITFFVVCAESYVRVKTIPADLHVWQILWQFITSYSIYTLFCYLINSQLVAQRHAEGIALHATNRAGEAEHKLLNIIEETQQRIGRELHDDLGQHLTGTAFMAQVLSQKLKEAGSDEIVDAEKITLMLNQAISKTRNISHGLYPAELGEHDLSNMLRKFADHVEEIYSVTCDFFSDENLQAMNQETSVHLFRITQEAVSNAVKHGHATHIILRRSFMPSSQVLEILDNGCGLDTKIPIQANGLGVRSMRYRADLIGAVLDVSSRTEGGTQVSIRMPIKPCELDARKAI